jgi:hypothetical protein
MVTIADNGTVLDIASDFQNLTHLISEGDKEEISVPGAAQSSWAERAKLLVFGSALKDGLSKTYQQHFLQRLASGTLRAGLLGGIISAVHTQWDSINRDKKALDASATWRASDGSFLKPTISYWAPETWDGDYDVCFDALIREALRDVCANVFHARHAIQNPWNVADRSQAHMWWKAEISQRYLQVQFINSSLDAKVLLKPSAPIAGLARVGGDLDISCEPSQQRLTVTVKIPLADTLVRDL